MTLWQKVSKTFAPKERKKERRLLCNVMILCHEFAATQSILGDLMCRPLNACGHT
jgi:hypothetical protein